MSFDQNLSLAISQKSNDRATVTNNNKLRVSGCLLLALSVSLNDQKGPNWLPTNAYLPSLEQNHVLITS